MLSKCSVSYLLLVPPSFLQLGIQAVGGHCPLLCKSADSALHEAEGLLSCPNLVQKYREVCAKSSLGKKVKGKTVKSEENR